MNSFFKRIKSAFKGFFSSTPAKVLKVVTVVMVGLLALTGFMQVLTYTVVAYSGLTTALRG